MNICGSFSARISKFCALVAAICQQDLQMRFAGSMLGSVWVLIWPLVQLFIYMVIFGRLMGARLGMDTSAWSYGFYIASGLLSWTLFSTSLAHCSRSLIDRQGIIRKVRVNLAVFPVASCLVELLPFAAGLILLVAADLLCGWLPSLPLLALLALALYIQLALALGIGLFCASFAVFAHDVAEAVGIALQMAFWFTPIVYLPSILPDWLARILWINPMTAVTGVFQQCFVLGGQPQWPGLIYAFVVAHLCLLLGFWAIVRLRKDILDVI